MTSLVKAVTSEAPVVLKNLNGLICLYKPADNQVVYYRRLLAHKIANELNTLDVRPPELHVSIVGDTSKALKVNVQPSYADHPAVLGPRYLARELHISYGNFLGPRTSGVLVLGINEGARQTRFLRNAHLMKTYLLKGKLGVATHNFFADGRVLFKGRYDFVTRGAFDKVTATMQALHRKMAFEACAIDGQSQKAYELASKGLLRPYKPDTPIIYGLKCTHFSPPDFTIEVQCINENEDFLIELVSQLGAKLRTAAICTQVKCIRFSHFDLSDALLYKHWTLQNLLDSVQSCNEKFRKIKNSIAATLVDLKKEEENVS